MKTLRPITTSLLQSSTRSPATCRPFYSIQSASQPALNDQRRTFLSNPLTPTVQTLVAQRTIRSPPSVVYSIISDVAAYSSFLPFCQASIVTKTSSPTEQDGKTYPEEAKLVIGFNDTVSETFTSRVYCIPNRVVEAVSGETKTTLATSDIAHHSPRAAAGEPDPSRKETVLSHLLTRWTLKPYHYQPPPTTGANPADAKKAVNPGEATDVPAQEKTEVNLTIEYAFANPMYAVMTGAAAGKVADKMIEAFERRVTAVMEGHGHAHSAAGKDEGVLRAK